MCFLGVSMKLERDIKKTGPCRSGTDYYYSPPLRHATGGFVLFQEEAIATDAPGAVRNCRTR